MQARMKELIAKINEADTAYYKYDTPILSDRDYDQLYDELVRLEKESGITLSGSPTQRVPGALLEGLVPVPHTRPMLSAAKTKSVAEVLRFIAGRAAILSWKLDGLTLVLRYENRELKQAITRGVDGLVGEDVTHTVRMMLNVPLTIPYTGPLEVRGEGVVSWANFKALNETLEDPYADPRGLAAGSIRKLNAEAVRARRLEFFAFDLISDDIGWLRKKEQLDFMAGQGFDVVPHILMEESTSADELEAHIKSMDPGKFGYPVDGLIFEYDDRSCPLLKDGLCSVHDCKPTVCALFPLGRVAVNKQKEDGTVDPRDFKIRYILNDIECGSAKRVNTVRSWLARFGIPEHDEFFILWNEVMMESGELVRLLEKKKAPEPLLQLIWNIQMNALYLQYDPSQDFFPQFQANAGRLLPLTKAIQQRVSSDQDGISLLLKGLEAGLHGQIGPAR